MVSGDPDHRGNRSADRELEQADQGRCAARGLGEIVERQCHGVGRDEPEADHGHEEARDDPSQPDASGDHKHEGDAGRRQHPETGGEETFGPEPAHQLRVGLRSEDHSAPFQRKEEAERFEARGGRCPP